MSPFLAQGKFHIVYTLKYIRYGLFLSLVPLANALFSWDWEAFSLALRQDILILIIMALASVLMWQRAGFQVSKAGLTLRSGLFVSRQLTLRSGEIAALTLERPLILRLLGCTRVQLYGTTTAHFKKLQCYLPRRQADALAECLLPSQSDATFYAPSGVERIRFTMLSVNLITTAALLYFSAQQTQKILGKNLGQELSQLAMSNLARIERLAELVLPAGMAWLFTLLFTLGGVALFWSLLSTTNFRVGRNGGVIHAKGGFINHSDQRILASAVSYCDIRTTPFARLLRCYPVYLTAGSYTSPLPLIMYKKGYENLLEALMPGFKPPPSKVVRLASDRSLPLFIWKGGVCFLLCAALAGVSMWKLPDWTPIFCVPCLLSLGLMAVAVEGWLREGIFQHKNGPLSLCFTRLFTRHDLCLFTQDICLTVRQSPFAQTVARCNLVIGLPSRRRIRVRAIKCYHADCIRLSS